jgi:hypothetical protein
MAGEAQKAAASGLGGVLAGLVWAAQASRDQQERLQTLRKTHRDLRTLLDSIAYGQDWLRLTAAVVRDFLTGFLAATSPPRAASVVPIPPIRPDLTAESGIQDIRWPPQVGEYNPNGETQAAGEIALAAYVLTYQEPRILLQAIAQATPPSPQAAVQLFRAVQALSREITAQALTLGEWRKLWALLFDRKSTPPTTFVTSEKTQGTTPAILATYEPSVDGVYVLRSVVTLSRADGVGGSLSIVATLTKYQGTLSLVRSDRLLAQLPSVLVGVDASFVAVASQVQLMVKGLASTALTWENHMKVYPPMSNRS